MLDSSNSLDNNNNNNNHISSPGINLPSNITTTGASTTTTTNSNAPIVLSSITSSQNNNSSISSLGLNSSLPVSNVNNLNFPRLNSIIEDSSYNFPSRRSSLYLGADFHIQSNQNIDPLHPGNQNNNIFARRDSLVYPRYSFDSSSSGMIAPSNSIINPGSSAPYQAPSSFIPGQENLAYDMQREYSFVYPSNNNNNNQFSGLGQPYSSERILHPSSSNHMFSGRRASEQLDPFITPSNPQQQQPQQQAQPQTQPQQQQQQQQQTNLHLPQQQYQQMQQMQQIPQALRSNSFLFKRISSIPQPMELAPNDIELFLKRDNGQKMFESTDILDTIPNYNDQHQSPHILPSQSKLPLQSRTGSALPQSLPSLPSRVSNSKSNISSGNSMISGSRLPTQMQQFQHVSTPLTQQPQSMYAQSPTHSWDGIKSNSNESYNENNAHQISKTLSNQLSGDISPSTIPENISDVQVKIEEIPPSNLSVRKRMNDSDAIPILNSKDNMNGNKKIKINDISINENIGDTGSEFKSIDKFKSNLIPENEPLQNDDGRPLIGATKVDQLMLVIQARKKGITGNIKQAADGSILEEIGENGRTVLPSPMELVGGVEKPNIRGRKQHQCQYCLKKFTQSTHLEVHIRSHMGLKPYECSYCGKRFTQGGNLRTHLRLHTGEKPFKCSLCGKLFSRKGNLQAHTLTHENLKPFQCKFDNCNKSFTQLGNLKAHQNRFHMATLNELTNKLAQISSSESFDLLPEKERELLLYFSNLYKNLNKGIRGRGKTHLNDGDDNNNDEKIMDSDS